MGKADFSKTYWNLKKRIFVLSSDVIEEVCSLMGAPQGVPHTWDSSFNSLVFARWGRSEVLSLAFDSSYCIPFHLFLRFFLSRTFSPVHTLKSGTMFVFNPTHASGCFSVQVCCMLPWHTQSLRFSLRAIVLSSDYVAICGRILMVVLI